MTWSITDPTVRRVWHGLRRDRRLTSCLKRSRLNRVSMIFLCEYDLTWTRTESRVRLGPGPSQVFKSQVKTESEYGPWVNIGSGNGLMAPSHYLNQCWLAITDRYRLSDIRLSLRVISPETPLPSITTISLKINGSGHETAAVFLPGFAINW